MLEFLKRFFTWWNGQTFGTQFYTSRYGEMVGRDEFGNTYYRTKGGKWVVEQIDLAALGAVEHDFTLTLLASDCPYSGHAGYVYLDGFGAVNPPTGQVPEPGSLALLGLGFAGLAAARQRQKKAA